MTQVPHIHAKFNDSRLVFSGKDFHKKEKCLNKVAKSGGQSAEESWEYWHLFSWESEIVSGHKFKYEQNQRTDSDWSVV